jgi:hypothetical protein
LSRVGAAPSKVFGMGIMEFVGAVLCAAVGGLVAWYFSRGLGVTRPLLAGMSVQAVATIGLYVAVGLWAPDAIKYDQMGQELAAFWQGGPDPTTQIGDGKEGFPAILGALYHLFGVHPASGLALNWAAHALLIVTVAATAKRMSLPIVRSAWIAALFPPVLLWSGLLLREALTWWLLSLIVFSIVGYATSAVLRHYLLFGAIFAGSISALFWMRGTAALIVGVGGVLVLVATSRRANLLARLALAVLLVALVLPRLGDLVGDYLPDDSGTTTSEPGDRISDIRESLGRDSTTSFGSTGSSEIVGRAANTAQVVLGPLPWEWPRVGGQIALDGLLWLGVLVASVVGAWRSRGRLRLVLLLVVPAALMLGALVVTSGNYGTMQRLRVQSTVLLIPVAAAGLERRRRDEPRVEDESGIEVTSP